MPSEGGNNSAVVDFLSFGPRLEDNTGIGLTKMGSFSVSGCVNIRSGGTLADSESSGAYPGVLNRVSDAAAETIRAAARLADAGVAANIVATRSPNLVGKAPESGAFHARSNRICEWVPETDLMGLNSRGSIPSVHLSLGPHGGGKPTAGASDYGGFLAQANRFGDWMTGTDLVGSDPRTHGENLGPHGDGKVPPTAETFATEGKKHMRLDFQHARPCSASNFLKMGTNRLPIDFLTRKKRIRLQMLRLRSKAFKGTFPFGFYSPLGLFHTLMECFGSALSVLAILI